MLFLAPSLGVHILCDYFLLFLGSVISNLELTKQAPRSGLVIHSTTSQLITIN